MKYVCLFTKTRALSNQTKRVQQKKTYRTHCQKPQASIDQGSCTCPHDSPEPANARNKKIKLNELINKLKKINTRQRRKKVRKK